MEFVKINDKCAHCMSDALTHLNEMCRDEYEFSHRGPKNADRTQRSKKNRQDARHKWRMTSGRASFFSLKKKKIEKKICPPATSANQSGK